MDRKIHGLIYVLQRSDGRGVGRRARRRLTSLAVEFRGDHLEHRLVTQAMNVQLRDNTIVASLTSPSQTVSMTHQSRGSFACLQGQLTRI